MKKILTVLLILVAALSTAFAFTACDLFETDDNGNNTADTNTANGGNSSGSNSSQNGNSSSGSSSGSNSSQGGNSSSGENTHVCEFVFKEKVYGCVTQGYDLYVCSCGKTEKRNYTAPVGHDYSWTYHNATCTTDWYQEGVCTRCGDKTVETVPDSKRHTYGEYISNNDATCVKDGTKTATCTSCGATNTVIDEGSATGVHTFGEYISNNDGNCQKDNTATAKCEHCSATDTITLTGSKGSHNYKWTVVNETCTEVTKNGVCTVCGDTTIYREVYYDAWDRHDFNWTEVHNATCTLDGYRKGTCSKCGYVFTEIFNATGHKPDGNNKCTVCGENVGLLTEKLSLNVTTDGAGLSFGTVYFEFVLINPEYKTIDSSVIMQYDLYVVQSYTINGITTVTREKVVLDRPDEIGSSFSITLRNVSSNQSVKLDGICDYSVIKNDRTIVFIVNSSGSINGIDYRISGNIEVEY